MLEAVNIVNIKMLVKNLCELRKSILKTSPKVDNRVLDDAFKAYERSLRKKPAPVQVLHRAGKFTQKLRKEQGVTLWRMLNMLGLLQKQVAYRIGVHPAYFSKVINEQEKSALSEEKLQKLETYVREKIIAVVKQIFSLHLAPLEVMSTGYTWSERFTSEEEGFIEKSVVNSIASLIAGRPEPPALPNGIPATSVLVDGGPHCEIYVIITKHDVKNTEQARIHEYDHLADYFRDKANYLRGSGEQPELPKQGL